MKNTRLIAAALAAVCLMNPITTMAQEPKKGIVRRSLIKAKKSLDDSLDRFKRCIGGKKCTREEKLKVARDVTVAALAVLALVGGGWYLAKKYLPMLRQRMGKPDDDMGKTSRRLSRRTISSEEFEHIKSSDPFFQNRPTAGKFLRPVFTERNDDYLAMFWLLRSFGAGFEVSSLGGGRDVGGPDVISFESLGIELNPAWAQAANTMNYGLAENTLKLAISSSRRRETYQELINAIMHEKGTDPLFRIAYLFARAGWFTNVVNPFAGNDEAKREIENILQNVNKDQNQIRRLQNFISETKISGLPHKERPSPLGTLVIKLNEWSQTH